MVCGWTQEALQGGLMLGPLTLTGDVRSDAPKPERKDSGGDEVLAGLAEGSHPPPSPLSLSKNSLLLIRGSLQVLRIDLLSHFDHACFAAMGITS